MTKRLSWEWLLQHTTARRLGEEVLQAPLESILHPSQIRLKWLGAFSLIGHPLFYWIWHDWLAQPYENFWLRCGIGLLGAPLMLDRVAGSPASHATQHLFNAVCFIQLPCFSAGCT